VIVGEEVVGDIVGLLVIVGEEVVGALVEIVGEEVVGEEVGAAVVGEVVVGEEVGPAVVVVGEDEVLVNMSAVLGGVHRGQSDNTYSGCMRQYWATAKVAHAAYFFTA
jgi:hypothetical protein